MSSLAHSARRALRILKYVGTKFVNVSKVGWHIFFNFEDLLAIKINSLLILGMFSLFVYDYIDSKNNNFLTRH